MSTDAETVRNAAALLRSGHPSLALEEIRWQAAEGNGDAAVPAPRGSQDTRQATS